MGVKSIAHAWAVVAIGVVVLAVAADAHGHLAIPESRNVFHNSNYCPHCLNGGGLGATRGTIYPNSIHGMCGDPAVGPFDHEAGGKFATGDITGVYEEGGLIHLAAGMSTYHKGIIEYRICRYRPGTPAEERAALTDECLNQNRLVQANIPEAQVPGSRWYFLGNASDSGYYPAKLFHHTFQLPDGLTCDNVEWKCVLQFHWIAGNSCNDPAILPQYRLGYLPRCKTGGMWPEEFWNCADIKILPKGSSGVDVPDPTWPAFTPALSSEPTGWGYDESEFLPDPTSGPSTPYPSTPPSPSPSGTNTQSSPSPPPPSPSPSPPPPPSPKPSPPPEQKPEVVDPPKSPSPSPSPIPSPPKSEDDGYEFTPYAPTETPSPSPSPKKKSPSPSPVRPASSPSPSPKKKSPPTSWKKRRSPPPPPPKKKSPWKKPSKKKTTKSSTRRALAPAQFAHA